MIIDNIIIIIMLFEFQILCIFKVGYVIKSEVFIDLEPVLLSPKSMNNAKVQLYLPNLAV